MPFEGATIKLKPGGFSAKLAYGELGLTDQQKRDRAIEDVKAFLGDDRFEALVNCIKYENRFPKNIVLVMGFMCAIEGYPVRAMIQRYHPVSIRLFGVDARGRNVVPLKKD